MELSEFERAVLTLWEKVLAGEHDPTLGEAAVIKELRDRLATPEEKKRLDEFDRMDAEANAASEHMESDGSVVLRVGDELVRFIPAKNGRPTILTGISDADGSLGSPSGETSEKANDE